MIGGKYGFANRAVRIAKPPANRHHESALTGATVTSVESGGKAMLTRSDNGLTLYSHNQIRNRRYTTGRGKFNNKVNSSSARWRWESRNILKISRLSQFSRLLLGYAS